MKIRSKKELQEAENEYYNKLWLVRTVFFSGKTLDEYAESNDPEKQKIAAKARAHEKEYIDKYYNGDRSLVENMGAWDYGYISGTLQALRWMLGDEWGVLDT